ncbi:MAG: hypothetical protein HC842_00030 [Cytophagales bacterium]|nr:hypothetical protein [Cytophagales bacterium]
MDINGKRFYKLKIYEATLFPLNEQDLKFPSVPIEMIKYKGVPNKTDFFGRRQLSRDTKPTPPKPRRYG